MNADAFLREFYTPPNIEYERIVGGLSEKLKHSLRSLEMGLEVPAFLPTRKRSDGSATWYGIISPGRPERELEDIARAAVDRSIGEVRTRQRLSGARGPTEELLDREFGRSWIRIDLPPDEACLRAARSALERQVQNLLRRPDVDLRLRRTIGRIRSDIDLAVAESDLHGADELLHELAQIPSITPDNRLHVTIDTYARLGRYRDVLELGDIDRIVNGRPPRRVRLAVLTCLRRVLPEQKSMSDPDWGGLPGSTRPLLAELLEQAPEPETIDQVEALLAAHLHTSATPSGTWAHIEQLLAALHGLGGDDAAWRSLMAIADVVTPEVAPRQVLQQQADSAADDADVRRVVAEAMVLGTPDAADIAVRCVDQVSPDLRNDALVGSTLRALDALAAGRSTAPSSWEEWIAWCSSGEGWADARQAAEDNLKAWGELDDRIIRRLTEEIEAAGEATAQNLRSALGLLLEHVSLDSTPADKRQLLLSAIELLALVAPTSHEERQAMLSWTDALLTEGLEERDYKRLVGSLSEVWREAASPGCTEWAIDVLAVLATAPVAPGSPRDLRRTFFWSVVHDITGWIPAMASEGRDTLASVARLQGEDLGELIRTDPEEEPLIYLRGQHLGMHTLMLSAAHTSIAVIHEAAPDCQIDLNTDHVETERLVALAEAADIFALVTGACKHEASRAVERHRPKEKPLLRVRGKGATAMLRALRGHARDGVAPTG